MSRLHNYFRRLNTFKDRQNSAHVQCTYIICILYIPSHLKKVYYCLNLYYSQQKKRNTIAALNMRTD